MYTNLVYVAGMKEGDNMFQEFISQNRLEMVESLQSLLRIESVKDLPQPNAPFGSGISNALEYVLELAQKYGFTTRNVDGYAGHVEWGTGEPYIGVLCHLDVVPAGSGWSSPPFDAVIKDGRVYARGALDDKGPAMAALWALVALKHSGVKTDRKIRIIFGLDEESDWHCVEHYFAQEPLPIGGFTPDADFPLIHAEKGCISLRMQIPTEIHNLSAHVICFEGGNRVNMVPSHAYAVIECLSETAATAWEQRLSKDSKQRQLSLDTSVNGSRLQLVVHGIAAHGSTPDAGRNAIIELAKLLCLNALSNASMWRTISQMDTRGELLGMACEDITTGPLTLNIGKASLVDGEFVFDFDVRYPLDKTPEFLLDACKTHIPDKWSVAILKNHDPHYVPVDSPVCTILRRVFEENTGMPGEPFAIGGATYARAIPNAVAFGPLFQSQPDLAHQADESWALDDYFTCIQIYAQAMFELANTL